ncbi:MAG TPA: IS1182 family transposase [Ktedonobacterales bacterium]|nr:IS1182 family transposase [Ktedonobacterales bacterium]
MLRPVPIGPVPDDTARVARAAFPKGHPYLSLTDALGTLFTDIQFAPLFPTHGQPALAPWRLVLVSILQFAEGLSDRQAAAAVRSRIDWKYVLRLELSDAGFDASVLSEFRTRLRRGDPEQLLLDTLLDWCRDHQLLNARGQQRTDSTHVLAAVRALNRLAVVWEVMRHALESLAVVAPAWLAALAPAAWSERYTRRADEARLPATQAARMELARLIGADGDALLEAVTAADAPPWLREVPALDLLRRVWLQNFAVQDERLQWRTEILGLPPAVHFISSPYDPEAHLATKRSTHWVGYKLHLTETCDDDLPSLITHVETSAAPVADGEATPRVHAALAARELLPDVHIVDTGYLDAALLVSSRTDFHVDLLGPTRADYHWQAREATGFAAEHFRINWERQTAICPAGHSSLSWTPAIDKRTNAVIKIKFSTNDCGPCPSRMLCTRSTKQSPRRTVTVRREDEYKALQAARERAHTADFVQTYAKRAGIEGTLSRAVRRTRLRRTRYIGAARVHLGHLLGAAALNFLRLGEWLTEAPHAKTRHSPFARLMATAA